MYRRLLDSFAFGAAGWFITAYALALTFPTETMAVLPAVLLGPIPIAGGVAAAVVGFFVVRR